MYIYGSIDRRIFSRALIIMFFLKMCCMYLKSKYWPCTYKWFLCIVRLTVPIVESSSLATFKSRLSGAWACLDNIQLQFKWWIFSIRSMSSHFGRLCLDKFFVCAWVLHVNSLSELRINSTSRITWTQMTIKGCLRTNTWNGIITLPCPMAACEYFPHETGGQWVYTWKSKTIKTMIYFIRRYRSWHVQPYHFIGHTKSLLNLPNFLLYPWSNR